MGLRDKLEVNRQTLTQQQEEADRIQREHEQAPTSQRIATLSQKARDLQLALDAMKDAYAHSTHVLDDFKSTQEVLDTDMREYTDVLHADDIHTRGQMVRHEKYRDEPESVEYVEAAHTLIQDVGTRKNAKERLHALTTPRPLHGVHREKSLQDIQDEVRALELEADTLTESLTEKAPERLEKTREEKEQILREEVASRLEPMFGRLPVERREYFSSGVVDHGSPERHTAEWFLDHVNRGMIVKDPDLDIATTLGEERVKHALSDEVLTLMAEYTEGDNKDTVQEVKDDLARIKSFDTDYHNAQQEAYRALRARDECVSTFASLLETNPEIFSKVKRYLTRSGEDEKSAASYYINHLGTMALGSFGDKGVDAVLERITDPRGEHSQYTTYTSRNGKVPVQDIHSNKKYTRTLLPDPHYMVETASRIRTFFENTQKLIQESPNQFPLKDFHTYDLMPEREPRIFDGPLRVEEDDGTLFIHSSSARLLNDAENRDWRGNPQLLEKYIHNQQELAKKRLVGIQAVLPFIIENNWASLARDRFAESHPHAQQLAHEITERSKVRERLESLLPDLKKARIALTEYLEVPITIAPSRSGRQITFTIQEDDSEIRREVAGLTQDTNLLGLLYTGKKDTENKKKREEPPRYDLLGRHAKHIRHLESDTESARSAFEQSNSRLTQINSILEKNDAIKKLLYTHLEKLTDALPDAQKRALTLEYHNGSITTVQGVLTYLEQQWDTTLNAPDDQEKMKIGTTYLELLETQQKAETAYFDMRKDVSKVVMRHIMKTAPHHSN